MNEITPKQREEINYRISAARCCISCKNFEHHSCELGDNDGCILHNIEVDPLGICDDYTRRDQ